MKDLVRRYINCSLRLRHLRCQSLREVEENTYNVLASWISPTPISRDGVVCMECFDCVQNAIQAGPVPIPAFGHTSVCLSCGISILRARTYRVPSVSEERNVIQDRIPSHLVPHLGRVCYACWMAARRIVQRCMQQDSSRLSLSHDSISSTVQDVAEVPSPIPEPPHLPEIDLFLPQTNQQEPKIISQVYKAESSQRPIRLL